MPQTLSAFNTLVRTSLLFRPWGNWGEAKAGNPFQRKREREWFGVLGQDPRQKVFCGSRTLQQGVKAVVKCMVPLMFSTRGKPWWSQCQCSCGTEYLLPPHSLTPFSWPPLPKDPVPSGTKGELTGGFQHRGRLIFAWQKVAGEILAALPQHLFWGWAVAFCMILTSLWWIKVLHTEKQLM